MSLTERQYNESFDNTDSWNFTTAMKYSEHNKTEMPYFLSEEVVDEAIRKIINVIGNVPVHSNHLEHMGKSLRGYF